MKINKKIVGYSEMASTKVTVAPTNMKVIESLQWHLRALFSDCPKAFLPIFFENAQAFVWAASELVDPLIVHHCDLYDYLVQERARIEAVYVAEKDATQTAELDRAETNEEWMARLAQTQEALEEQIKDIEARYEFALSESVECYDESEAYNALSGLYLTVLSLRTLSYCHYWSDEIDQTEFQKISLALLEKMYGPLSTHYQPFNRLDTPRLVHESELVTPDSRPFAEKSASGIVSWPCRFHPNEIQDYCVVTPGFTVVLDGVSRPPSHGASREAGDYISARINSELSQFLAGSHGDPNSEEWQRQVFELLYEAVRASVDSISDFNQATTLALNVVIRVNQPDSEPRYMLFSLHFGDSETMTFDPSSRTGCPLNPLLTLDDFSVEQLFEDRFTTIWSPQMVMDKLRVPQKRDFSNPGLCLQKGPVLIPGFGTLAVVEKDTWIITFTDGLKDNFNHVKIPINAHRHLVDIINRFVDNGVSKSQLAFGMAALAKLHNAHCDSDYQFYGDASKLHGKEDDVTAVVRSVADQYFDYFYEPTSFRRVLSVPDLMVKKEAQKRPGSA